MKKYLSRLLLNYLRLLAKIQLKKYHPDIIGITGSAGKTTTMYAVESVLKDKYYLKVSHKANSQSGISLNILDISPTDYSLLDWLKIACIKAPLSLIKTWPKYHKYIVEMGIDSPHPPGNMEYLLSIVKPRTGIFLHVNTVHGQMFDELVSAGTMTSRVKAIEKAIAHEKGKMIQSLPENGLAILNYDDPYVRPFINKTAAQVITFGFDKKADVRIINTKHNLAGTSITFQYQDNTETLELKSFLLPTKASSSLAAALCLAIDEDYTLKEAITLLEKNFNLPPGRSSLIPGIRGSLILDSSYNASPGPVIDLLDLVDEIKPPKSILVLGDMRELGSVSQEEHQKVLKKAFSISPYLVLRGPQMHQAAKELKLDNHTHVYLAVSNQDAAEHIKKSIKPGDFIALKGSQNTIFLEEVVKMLMANPKKAAKLLARQSSYWDKVRATS